MESITNKFVFIALQAVSWVIFVALCIEAGGLLVNFIFSLLKPEMVSRLYQKLNLLKCIWLIGLPIMFFIM